MGRLKVLFCFLMFIISVNTINSQTQRFPKPEFEQGYTQPPTIVPDARAEIFSYLDIVVLVIALSLASWFIIKKRSRRGIFWLTIFSLAYFGFYREGCICAVGSVQNVTLALFNPAYSIPITALLFFIIPILFTLFFGRTFCSSVCPLGAIQDIVALKPMPLKTWVNKTFGLIPFIYLALSILYAATSTDFIICRYDPFVGFFRLHGTFMMFAIGAILLLVGIFIARPYCRFFCPYGVILNWASRVSKNHMTITPSECIDCNLCEHSCPYDAINIPVAKKDNETKTDSVKRYITISIILPVVVLLSGYIGSNFHKNLASANTKVILLEKIIKSENSNTSSDLDIIAFKASGKTVEQLNNEVSSIMNQFYYGSWILGAFIGLIICLTLFSATVQRYREGYSPNKGTCLSCGRCMDYCPVGKDIDSTAIPTE